MPSIRNNLLLVVSIDWILFSPLCHGFHINWTIRSPLTAPASLSQSKSPNEMQEEARRLREKAQRLKDEVQARQSEKDAEAEEARLEAERIKAEKLDRRLRYSVEIPILKGDGSTAMERVDFPPRLADGKALEWNLISD